MTDHRFDQIDSVSLSTVNGGEKLSGKVAGAQLEWSTTQRQDCEAGAERRAYQRYPDTRWFWQRWTGTGTDTNAEARYQAQQADVLKTCSLPQ